MVWSSTSNSHKMISLHKAKSFMAEYTSSMTSNIWCLKLTFVYNVMVHLIFANPNVINSKHLFFATICRCIYRQTPTVWEQKSSSTPFNHLFHLKTMQFHRNYFYKKFHLSTIKPIDRDARRLGIDSICI